MEVKEIIKLKEELEKTTAESIAAFCYQTGVTINDVKLECHEAKNAMGQVINHGYVVRIYAQI